jgi:hypothetical protein
MNVNEMTLGGIKVAQLKEMNALVKRDASKFMAEQIEFVKSEVESIIKALDEDDNVIQPDEQRVKNLVDILNAVAVVSKVSGVEYWLPYSDEYGYNIDGSMLAALDEAFENVYSREDALGDLFGTLEDMEGTVRAWNQSTC